MDRGAIQKVYGKRLGTTSVGNSIENGALLPLEAQMIFELSRILEGIDLRLAVGT